jgi:hypothetical protein
VSQRNTKLWSPDRNPQHNENHWGDWQPLCELGLHRISAQAIIVASTTQLGYLGHATWPSGAAGAQGEALRI